MRIIFFDPFIVQYERCQASIGDKVIWNCERFLELLETETVLDEAIFRPRSTGGEEFISLGGWLINMSSTISGNATYNEISEGWNLINNKDDRYVLDRIFQIFFNQSVSNAITDPLSEFSKQEPLILELLRLSYWYFKCYKALHGLEDISPSKRKEIRDKLFRKLLSKIEAYKTRFLMEEDYPEEKEAFLKKVNENMKHVKAAKKVDTEFHNLTKELFIAVRSVNSELIFAGILGGKNELGFHKTSDFTLDNIPCQVKTIIPSESSFKEISRKISDRINGLDVGKIIDETEVRREIISLLREEHDLIDDAIQGGKIICINGTGTYAGYLLNKWSSDNANISLNVDKESPTSINLVTIEHSISLLRNKEELLLLIFAAAAIDINYRFTTLAFKAPVGLALDDKSLDKIEIL